MADIHETAIIEQGAILADDVKVGPYCFIGKDVRIGSGTSLFSHVVVGGITEIGEGNEIYPFASIGLANQDLKYKGEATKTIIGNRNRIRECVTIHRGTDASWETRIGDGNLLMAYVHVAHDVRIGNGCVLANNVTLAGHVTVEDYAIIGGLTPAHQFTRIGAYSMTGGNSGIAQDICPFCLAEGERAEMKGLNSIGLRRHGFTDEDLSNLKKAYRLIFRSGLPLKEALRQVEESFGQDEHVMYLVNFIRSSQRGIAR
ncbi:MAG: acyl-ACP--UDP-N-acetylglucosamine O-acyltransferase [Fusobacteriaceae bacterium]|nr:acyl-ACP--UDP-N-acetylglucosamine O-acyltransferase [Fusobacteriaceae bacterium]